MIFPIRPQFLIQKQAKLKNDMELEVRKRANIIEKLDSIKSFKKNKNFSSTKFPTKLLGSIGNKKSPTKSRESSKFSKLPENKRSFS